MTTAYPLSWPQGWPRAQNRKGAKFNRKDRVGVEGPRLRTRGLTITDGTVRVLRELKALGVPHGEAVISTNIPLRLDGMPRSDKVAPIDPGVAVYWRRRAGEATKVMAIDLYDRVADNLAAIAATLEAMRAIERHGGAQVLERAFTGFTALPPPKLPRQVLGVPPNASRDQVLEAYRRKAAAAHPDRPSGSHEAMAELNQARDAALQA